MMNDDLSAIWKALSHPVRREILDLLKERPLPTGELCDAFDTSRFAVMQHIGVLKDAGLIVVRPRGRERWNHLNAVPLQEIYDRWLGPYEAHWASSLTRLKAQVEAPEGDRLAMSQDVASLPAVTHFEIEQEVTVDAPPQRVYSAFVDDIDKWWAHRDSSDPGTMTLEPRIGGHFLEAFTSGGGALRATVTGIREGAYLAMSGPMGMPGPVVSDMKFRFDERDGGTVLQLSHRVVGMVDAQTRQMYDEGWRYLFEQCLKPLVEGKSQAERG